MANDNRSTDNSRVAAPYAYDGGGLLRDDKATEFIAQVSDIIGKNEEYVSNQLYDFLASADLNAESDIAELMHYRAELMFGYVDFMKSLDVKSEKTQNELYELFYAMITPKTRLEIAKDFIARVSDEIDENDAATVSKQLSDFLATADRKTESGRAELKARYDTFMEGLGVTSVETQNELYDLFYAMIAPKTRLEIAMDFIARVSKEIGENDDATVSKQLSDFLATADMNAESGRAELLSGYVTFMDKLGVTSKKAKDRLYLLFCDMITSEPLKTLKQIAIALDPHVLPPRLVSKLEILRGFFDGKNQPKIDPQAFKEKIQEFDKIIKANKVRKLAHLKACIRSVRDDNGQDFSDDLHDALNAYLGESQTGSPQRFRFTNASQTPRSARNLETKGSSQDKLFKSLKRCRRRIKALEREYNPEKYAQTKKQLREARAEEIFILTQFHSDSEVKSAILQALKDYQEAHNQTQDQYLLEELVNKEDFEQLKNEFEKYVQEKTAENAELEKAYAETLSERKQIFEDLEKELANEITIHTFVQTVVQDYYNNKYSTPPPSPKESFVERGLNFAARVLTSRERRATQKGFDEIFEAAYEAHRIDDMLLDRVKIYDDIQQFKNENPACTPRQLEQAKKRITDKHRGTIPKENKEARRAFIHQLVKTQVGDPIRNSKDRKERKISLENNLANLSSKIVELRDVLFILEGKSIIINGKLPRKTRGVLSQTTGPEKLPTLEEQLEGLEEECDEKTSQMLLLERQLAEKWNIYEQFEQDYNVGDPKEDKPNPIIKKLIQLRWRKTKPEGKSKYEGYVNFGKEKKEFSSLQRKKKALDKKYKALEIGDLRHQLGKIRSVVTLQKQLVKKKIALEQREAGNETGSPTIEQEIKELLNQLEGYESALTLEQELAEQWDKYNKFQRTYDQEHPRAKKKAREFVLNKKFQALGIQALDDQLNAGDPEYQARQLGYTDDRELGGQSAAEKRKHDLQKRIKEYDIEVADKFLPRVLYDAMNPMDFIPIDDTKRLPLLESASQRSFASQRSASQGSASQRSAYSSNRNSPWFLGGRGGGGGSAASAAPVYPAAALSSAGSFRLPVSPSSSSSFSNEEEQKPWEGNRPKQHKPPLYPQTPPVTGRNGAPPVAEAKRQPGPLTEQNLSSRYPNGKRRIRPGYETKIPSPPAVELKDEGDPKSSKRKKNGMPEEKPTPFFSNGLTTPTVTTPAYARTLVKHQSSGAATNSHNIWSSGRATGADPKKRNQEKVFFPLGSRGADPAGGGHATGSVSTPPKPKSRRGRRSQKSG